MCKRFEGQTCDCSGLTCMTTLEESKMARPARASIIRFTYINRIFEWNACNCY